jgi:hypothetical protein
MKTRIVCSALLWVTLILSCSSELDATMVVSDGSDGPFNPASSQTIILDNVAPDGIFNFTTIFIPQGVTIRFQRNAGNTPVYFAATGDVVINGLIDVSGTNFSRTGGPGGGDGGNGSRNAAGTAGFGPSPGQGGPVTVNQGNAGGGGGMATPGLTATSRTGTSPAPGGPAVEFPEPFAGGSGGGGGGGRLFFGVDISGGDGGGGGGALQISTPADMTINGSILSNGAHGGWAFANVFAHGGPGGGGSGGNIDLYANGINILGSAVIRAVGGAGGGLSTEPVSWDPYRYSSGANGGQGYLRMNANSVYIDSQSTIEAVIATVPGNISGHVTLQNTVNQSVQVTFELRQPGTTNIITNASNDEDGSTPGTQVTTGSDGSYALTDVPEGTYDITSQGLKWLRQKKINVGILSGSTANLDFSLRGGDANHSNSVNIQDLNILKASYGKSSDQPGYDDRADFNQDSSVNVLDLNILKSNYGKAGDE